MDARSLCTVCRRPRKVRRPRKATRCAACATYFRRHGAERPYRFSGNRERRGQLPLPIEWEVG